MHYFVRTLIAAASLALLASCASTGENTEENAREATAQPQGVEQQAAGQAEAYSYPYGQAPSNYDADVYKRQGLVCLLRITITGSGQVTNVQVVKGSGDSLFDNSAVAAARRASPLPMPADPAVAQELRPTFILRFRPK